MLMIGENGPDVNGEKGTRVYVYLRIRKTGERGSGSSAEITFGQ